MKKNLLLDTCVLLWILQGNERIIEKPEVMEQLNSRFRFFSSISIAEIEIKKSIGKLEIPDVYINAVTASGIQELPYDAESASQLGELHHFHEDPFDRMLITSAKVHNLIVVTGDTIFTKYGIETILV
ncbi:MAG: type II toxin-antitoxin system VapC family toxin [Spirochaetia bacterium]